MSRQNRFVLLLLTSLAITIPRLVSSDGGILYRVIKLSRSRLAAGSRTAISLPAPATSLRYSHTCFNSCTELDWCDLWCQDPTSVGYCHLASMYVVAQYNETDMADALTCYIKNKRDFVTGVTIEGAPPRSINAQRVKENLIDGIYTMHIDECYIPNDYANPSFKLDLGSLKLIQQVFIVLQPNVYAQYAIGIEVRVGTEEVPAPDFSNYKLFGYFPGPSSLGQEIFLRQSNPVIARYVIFRRPTDPNICDGMPRNPCQFQICHIEIN